MRPGIASARFLASNAEGETGMRKISTIGMAFGGIILLIAGCHSNTVDQAAFK
jgi:hypothetical protein